MHVYRSTETRTMLFRVTSVTLLVSSFKLYSYIHMMEKLTFTHTTLTHAVTHKHTHSWYRIHGKFCGMKFSLNRKQTGFRNYIFADHRFIVER